MKPTVFALLGLSVFASPAMAALYSYQVDFLLEEIEVASANTTITEADVAGIMGVGLGETFSISFTVDTEGTMPGIPDEPGFNAAPILAESIKLVNPGTAPWTMPGGLFALDSNGVDASILAVFHEEVAGVLPDYTLGESFYTWNVQGFADGSGIYTDPSLSFPTPSEVALFAPGSGFVGLNKVSCGSAVCDENGGDFVMEYSIAFQSQTVTMGPASAPDNAVVPLPAGIVLLGGALAGLTVLRRRA